MKDQKQEPMFPEIDLENIDAGDLIGVTDWMCDWTGINPVSPPQAGWYEVNDYNSATAPPERIERRQLAQRAWWDGIHWILRNSGADDPVLRDGHHIGQITVWNIVWRGLKAPWPTQE